MNIQQPKIDLKNTFSLYLEGIPVEFTSISISEKEGGIPSASIAFASGYGAMRILPGTIVQIFGKVHFENTEYLLFEGEVTAINYQRTSSQKMVVLKAISLLSGMIKAKYLPSDRIVSQEYKDATGIQQSKVVIRNDKDKDSAQGQQQIDKIKDIKNEKEPVICSGKVKDLTITSLFGLADDFSRYLTADQPGGKGDFYPMLQEFSKTFEYNDLFYGLKSLSYKFARSMFVAPNPDLLNKIKIELFLESMNNVRSSGLGTVYSEMPFSLMQIMIEFQRYLHYDFLSPASYTACRPFYVKGNKAWEPLRMMYVPKLEVGPPALCNVFFPEQLSGYTYSREMMDEPTRVIGRATTSLLTKQQVDISPCILYPDLDLQTNSASANFSLEESYRGINYKTIPYNDLHSEIITDKKTTKGDGKSSTKNADITDKDIKGEIGDIIKPFAYMDYLSLRYQGRQTSVSAEWSPYRMIGLPALILDDSGVSIVGVVTMLETQIDANGSATTRAVLRSTKLIFNDEFEKTPFSTVPSDNIEGFEKFLIHDLTNDGMIASNPLMFYEDLYSFEKIGMDIYTYITNGMLSANEGLYKLTNAGAEEYKLESKDILDYAEDRLNPANFEIPIHPRIDNSILNFLRGANEKGYVDGNINIVIPDEYNVKTEMRNTFLLYRAVVELKNQYNSKKFITKGTEKKYNMEQAYNFAHSVNRRNIISKEDYFNFIGAKINRTSLDEDAHDGQYILTEGVDILRETILKMSDLQFSQIVDTTESHKLNLKKSIASETKKITAYDSQLNTLGTYTDFVSTSERNKVLKLKKESEDNLKNYQKELADLDKQTTEVTEKNFDSEIYKPYNMNRRMHVVYAFKNDGSSNGILRVIK